MFIKFCIDYNTQKIELLSSGHVYLNKEDKESDTYKYYAMRSIISLVDKKFRKTKFKDQNDIVDKISTYANKVYGALEIYANGYPYNHK